jgi:hypothetical protein
VNLIFRLEKLAGSLGEPCGLSEAAHTKLRELVPARPLGEFELKGFEGKRGPFFASLASVAAPKVPKTLGVRKRVEI